MSDYEPGMVAVVEYEDGDTYLALWDAFNEGWVSGDGRLYADVGDIKVRPLVVIDPESAEDVTRLWRLMSTNDTPPDVAAALREFAAPTPPKPAEPQGLGAVVEDGGVRYTRWSPSDIAPWIAAFPVDANRPYRYWSGFSNAVRVLSEGVTP